MPRSLPSLRRAVIVIALTAGTAVVARWLRRAVEARPDYRDMAPPAASKPAPARDEQRLADTLLWRLVERQVVERAVRPLKQAPGFMPVRVVNLDHGPGGIACALAQTLPQDATVVAIDREEGMADLAHHRAVRRLRYRQVPQFVRASPNALPFRDGAFDLLVSAGGMHHWANPQAAFPEARRVIADGGWYLLLDFRRTLSLGAWLLVRFVQALLTPKDLREMDEPSASIGAAFAPHEAEWLAARAGFLDYRIRQGALWLAIVRAESTEAVARTYYSLK